MKKIKCFFCDEKDREDYMTTYKGKPMCAGCRAGTDTDTRDAIIDTS